MKHRFPFLAAGIFGATGVALAAYGAHKLAPFLLERGTQNAWETAARYHLIHAIALLGVAVWARQAHGTEVRWPRWAAGCWTAGLILFSGSLYLLAVGGPRWLGPITPFGGLALIAGWCCIVMGAFTKEE